MMRKPIRVAARAGADASWWSSACRTRTSPGRTCSTLYVARQYAGVFSCRSSALLGMFYIATFIDLADKLFRGVATHGVMLLRYFYFATPQYVYYIIPMAALVATLVTIGLLTKNSELIVMRACGISLYRIGAAAGALRLVFSARAVRAAGASAGHIEPRSAALERDHARLPDADGGRAEPPVDHRQERRHLPLSGIRSAA